ncbi:hypothetical protein CIB84_015436 [Bambusicola thoracicus]|uniref:Uncharacterized protein n=1 Tax=Bambusicola thoracicus TaxID=9083 RepID=A0A2P4S9P1_BAMTH|nr:hypothetical protein CIB84_015436 [Bambusicola thoracicus]
MTLDTTDMFMDQRPCSQPSRPDQSLTRRNIVELLLLFPELL